MGVDLHGLNLLRLVAKKQRFRRVATLGRQGLGVPKDHLQKMGLDVSRYGEYCDELLLDNFGATSVESFDYSDFEGATHVADFNLPLVGFDSAFDTLIDFGTTEHIFNAPQALRNVSAMCATGGQIIHSLPANNLCNHGFWQFSPELFFSLYSERNGYVDTEIYLADVGESEFWYRLTAPRDGHWDYLASGRALYVMVRTVKRDSAASFRSVQQAQYVNDWQSPSANGKTPGGLAVIKAAIKRTPIAKQAMAIYRRALFNPDATLKKSRQLQKVSIASL